MHINAQSLARGWAYGKKVIGDGWNHAVRIGHGADHAMRVGKRLMRGVQAYDEGRSQAMDHYTNVMAHHSRIKRQVPELDL